MTTPLLPTLGFEDCTTRADVEARIESWLGLVFSYRRLHGLAYLLTAAALRGDADVDDRVEAVTAVNEGFESDARTALLALCEMLPPSTRPQ